jgi:hypothetical protein
MWRCSARATFWPSQCRTSSHELSIVSAFIDRQQSSAERTLRMPMWVKVARHAFIESTEVNEDVDYWFDIGVGKLRRDTRVDRWKFLSHSLQRCCSVPRSKSTKTALWGSIRCWRRCWRCPSSQNESARGFLAEVFLIPVIHRFILRSKFGTRGQGGARDFVAVPHAELVDGARQFEHFHARGQGGPRRRSPVRRQQRGRVGAARSARSSSAPT